jgi:hypothetical protein
MRAFFYCGYLHCTRYPIVLHFPLGLRYLLLTVQDSFSSSSVSDSLWFLFWLQFFYYFLQMLQETQFL